MTEGKRRSLCIFSIRPPRLLRFRRSTKKHLTRVCLFERATRHDESRERERLTRIREMRWKYNLYLLLRDLYLLKKKKTGGGNPSFSILSKAASKFGKQSGLAGLSSLIWKFFVQILSSTNVFSRFRFFLKESFRLAELLAELRHLGIIGLFDFFFIFTG